MKKYLVIKFAILIVIVFVFTPAVRANVMFSSNFLNNNFVDTTFLLEDTNRFSGNTYNFLSGLSTIGIKTYNRDIDNILTDFRYNTGDVGTNNKEIHSSDILALDNMLSRQELLDVMRIEFYSKRYPHLNIHSLRKLPNNHFIAQTYLALSYIPSFHSSYINEVELFQNSGGFNGFSADNKIKIRTNYLMDDSKFTSLLMHEIGHLVDRGTVGKSGIPSSYMDFDKTVYKDDPSVVFYNLSWVNSNTKRTNISKLDFVSSYAMENPFEDFAESYSLYVNQGEYFKCLATSSNFLAQKYGFLKDNLFNGKEYYTGSGNCNRFERVEDVTDIY